LQKFLIQPPKRSDIRIKDISKSINLKDTQEVTVASKKEELSYKPGNKRIFK
jgi:hypothetical protein